MAPTAEELQAMADEEEDEQALSQAINTLVGTQVGRNAKASEKVLLNRKQALEGSHGGRGSRGRA